MQLMTKLFCATLLILAVAVADSQVGHKPEDQRNSMRRVCGFLTSVHLKPIGGKGYEVVEKPLRDATVRLYRRESDKRCCDPSHLVAQRNAGWRGVFKMDNQPKGTYWLTVEASSKVYELPISVEPADTKTPCSKQNFAVVDEGKLTFGRTISVD
jgi:hypothetical protein